MYNVIYKNTMTDEVVRLEKDMNASEIPHRLDGIKIGNSLFQVTSRVKIVEKKTYLLNIKLVKH